MITIGRVSLVVRTYQAGGGDIRAPLWLLGVAGPLFGYAVEVRASTVIGRQATGPNEADVLIPVNGPQDEALSRQHARLTWVPGDVVEFRDISRHSEEIGSWVNRRRAQRGLSVPVRPGDEVMIGPWGRHVFRLVRHKEWDFRPPRRIPAAGTVLQGWTARILWPACAVAILIAGGLLVATGQLALGIGGAVVGIALFGLWRVRILRRRLRVFTHGQNLEGSIRV
jgi:hypothetical protein